MLPLIGKSFKILGDEITELSTKIKEFKDKLGYFNKQYLVETKAKQMKGISDEKMLPFHLD